MNPLRNPAVVAALAVTAVVLVAVNLVWPRRGARPWSTAAQKTASMSSPAAIPAAVPAQVSITQQAPVPPDLADPGNPTTDWRQVQTNATNWVQAPHRDPFRSRVDPQTQAARFLRLQGVWRQTGSNLAVINDRVLTEGDRILDFTIEQIAADRVWVSGPNGREELSFSAQRPGNTLTNEPRSQTP